MLNKIFLLFWTIRYLKFIQIWHRLIKFIKSIGPKGYTNRIIKFTKCPEPLSIEQSFFNFYGKVDVKNENISFEFLNQSKTFQLHHVNWNYSNFGKLWNYNLNYFDFLSLKSLDLKIKIILIHDFIQNYSSLTAGADSYPISLRCINWIKFLCFNGIKDLMIVNHIYSQYIHLSKNLEYHVLGNHILENGLSLLIGSYYFRSEHLYHLAYKVIHEELEEQILDDGGHFELSPMYHQILLSRIIDCIIVISNNPWKSDDLNSLLIRKAELMLGWLESVTFSNGDIPMVNDSVYDMAPRSYDLFKKAKKIGLIWNRTILVSSGYRMVKSCGFEIFIDIGNIGPDYIPAHAHADSLSFILYYKGEPILVDPGVSTYQNNDQRKREKSTKSHNTICIDNMNSSEIWGSFRVGRRARINLHKDSKDFISASHDGYKKKGLICQRSFEIDQGTIKVIDKIFGRRERLKSAIFNLYFHPNCIISQKGNTLIVSDIIMTFIGVKSLRLKEYNYAEGFNKLKLAVKVEVWIEPTSILKIAHLKRI